MSKKLLKHNKRQKWVKYLSKHFSREDVQRANKHMKKTQIHYLSEKYKSKSQWDTTLHPIGQPDRVIKTSVGEGLEKFAFLPEITYWLECKMGHPFWK